MDVRRCVTTYAQEIAKTIALIRVLAVVATVLEAVQVHVTLTAMPGVLIRAALPVQQRAIAHVLAALWLYYINW